MTVKVALNGFGRIGRMAFRAIAKDFSDIQVVGINDLLDADYLAYMLKYDSVHGNFDGDIAVEGNNLIVNGNTIAYPSLDCRSIGSFDCVPVQGGWGLEMVCTCHEQRRQQPHRGPRRRRRGERRHGVRLRHRARRRAAPAPRR